MLRWVVLLLFLLGLGYIVLHVWVKKVSKPHTARPLFHEWEERDQGWQWATDGPVTDKSGNWLFCDKVLNLLVITSTRDPQFTGSLNFYKPGHAVVHAKSPYETKVDGAKNALIIVIPGRACGQFRIEPELAGRICEILWEERLDDLIPEIVRRYRGPDEQLLSNFIESRFEEQASTSSPWTKPSTP